MLAQLVQDLDPFKEVTWLKHTIFGNSVYAYGLSLASFLIIWIGLWLIRRVIIRRAESRMPADLPAALSPRQIFDSIKPHVFPLLALYLATRRLAIAPVFDRTLTYIVSLVVVVQIIFVITGVATFFINRSKLSQVDEADSLQARSSARNMVILVKTIAWVAGILFLLDNFGINVSTFIAGLGIGGVTIALATQAVLADTFSSFAIGLDKPFEIGDFIIVDTLMGTVEHVGLKTTRIRSLGGELLVFANSDLTAARIRNYKKMAERRIAFRVGVTYDTPQALMAKIPAMLQDAVTSQESARFDRAHFFEFGASSLNFEVVYYVLSQDYAVYMDTQQAINLTIMKAFEANGISFAFPTQTLHIGSLPPTVPT